MGIYPVKIRGFFKSHRCSSRSTMKQITRGRYLKCSVCGKTVTWDKGWCLHSLPYGGPSRSWCSERCLEGD